ncbi:MAG: cell division protein ZapA, partial [Clostridia bacterium]
MEKIRTTVRIAGKEYAMASYDSEAYVQRVASYVDRKMNELALSTRLPAVQLAVLTALNVADDMIKAHDENDRLKRELGRTRDELEAAQAQIKRQVFKESTAWMLVDVLKGCVGENGTGKKANFGDFTVAGK